MSCIISAEFILLKGNSMKFGNYLHDQESYKLYIAQSTVHCNLQCTHTKLHICTKFNVQACMYNLVQTT